MKDEIPHNWGPDFADDNDKINPVFEARLNNFMAVHDDQGLFTRVKSNDLWAIIKLTLNARIVPEEDWEKEMPISSASTIEEQDKLFMDVLNGKRSPHILVRSALANKADEEVFKFHQMLAGRLTPKEQEQYRGRYNAMIEEADNITRLAIKSNRPDLVKNAALIWGNILDIQGENKCTD